MPITDTQALYDRFHALARVYLAEPGLKAGLELDEVAVQLKQRAASELADSRLTDLLHRFLRAIPGQDRDNLAPLLDAILERAAEHELVPSAAERSG